VIRITSRGEPEHQPLCNLARGPGQKRQGPGTAGRRQNLDLDRHLLAAPTVANDVVGQGLDHAQTREEGRFRHSLTLGAASPPV
jgi:hypothetical protein